MKSQDFQYTGVMATLLSLFPRMKETLLSELPCISVDAMQKYLINTKISFSYLMMPTLQCLALGFVYSVGTFKRHGGPPSGVPWFLNQSEQRQPFSEVFYYSKSGLLHLPRYEVQFEIKIFYLPLQQIERL